MEERSLFLSWWLKPSLWRAFLHNWHILLLQLSYLKTPQIGKRYLKTTMAKHLLQLDQRARFLINSDSTSMSKRIERLVFLQQLRLPFVFSP